MPERKRVTGKTLNSEQQIVPTNPYQERDNWLGRLPGDEALFVQYFIRRILHFSQGKYSKFFENCGLYAVGSSVSNGGQEKGAHKDIDIVLAGLDFRAVIAYDGVFLMDPETLIEKEVVTPPKFFQVLEDDGNGEPTLLKPAGETEEYVYGYHGITYEGVVYNYNPYTFSTPPGSLEEHCLNSARLSELVTSLLQVLESDDKMRCRDYRRPFGNYAYGEGGDSYFVTTRFEIVPQVSTQESTILAIPSGRRTDQTAIDFNIHAENLSVPGWETYHREEGLPFVCLHRWPGDNCSSRPILTQMCLPDFVDSEGRVRVKRSLFTHGLRDLPIVAI